MLCSSCKYPVLPPDALPTPAQNQELMEVLRSSTIPSDPSHHHSAISTFTTTLGRYDSEIQKLQEALQNMLSDRTKLQKYVDGCRSAVSHVRRLPPEILCEIFASFSSPTEYKLELLQISHVCVRWRSLVMETPRLWSNIAIDASMWTPESDRFIQLLRLCLERGARHPLTLSVDFGILSSVQAQGLFKLFAEHSDRWEQVSFSMRARHLNMLRRVRVERGLDSLRRLSLSLDLVSLTEEEMEDIGNVGIFQDAPKLQHVHLNTYDLPFCPKLPWRQLRTFTYQCGYTTELAPFMAFIGNLSHPEVAFELRDFNPARLDTILPLPPIRSTISSLLVAPDTYMVEHQQSTQALGQILGCLTLPHLRELHIPLQEAQTCWPVNQFESLSSRSSFYDTLRVLELSGVTITADELVRSIMSLASLERLAISDHRPMHDTNLPDHVLISDSLLLHLTRDFDKSDLSLVPQLKYFGCTSLCRFSTQVLVDFMASRVAPGKVPFQTVIHRLDDASIEFEPQTFQHLQALVQNGYLRFDLR